MTPLDKQLRRELMIEGKVYTLFLDPAGLKLVEKERRKGLNLISGDAALATSLQASLKAP